ncbi:hypothetical protein C7S18_11855 [Ahniella affigens]|uniref:Uncharacterized protein n=1 Tax=Ahniella affigens TaxID=2021234 RepID=A0A2P1PSL7_9GAMM|nr:hypothetical protein [Ahniella affigens]AVP97846.1 hypothetical protein C7S18_11855 [Ahniella affigens]
MLTIQLLPPARVNDQIARPQSLWLLLRLCLAADAPTGEDWLLADELRDAHPQASHLRMLISRAFSDFANWGVQVGWGLDRSREPSWLARAKRNRGPFWLAPGERNRIRINIGERPARPEEVRLWLGMAAPARSKKSRQSILAATGPDYWFRYAKARRDMLDGQLIVDAEHGALAGFRMAAKQTSDRRMQALALLQQAMVWRRAGNADAAMQVLDELTRLRRPQSGAEIGWLGAMAEVVRAWCAYAERNLAEAERLLQAARVDPRWRAHFQYHPRVQTEQANLQALIHRARALDANRPGPQRMQDAAQAIQHYRSALSLAHEAELFDGAASAASNLGWTLWLFQHSDISVPDTEDDMPLRWIALASWLAETHGNALSAWNQIYLLRMVRAGGPSAEGPDMPGFRAWPVLSPAAYRQQVAPIAIPKQPSRWLDVVRAMQAEIDRGSRQIDALQRANVLLELAWYEAYEGEPSASTRAVARLRQRLRELTEPDRAFFRAALGRLPARP